MYFILKNATFSNAIGTISVQEGNVGGGGNGGSTTPTNVTFTINPTPSNATVTLTASGYTQSGNSITVLSGTKVSYTVSASGYTTKSGSKTVSYTQSLGIVLSAAGSGGTNPPSDGGSGSGGNDSYTWVEMTNYVVKNTAISESGGAISGVTDVVRHNFTVPGPGLYRATGTYSTGAGIVCFGNGTKLTHEMPSSPFTNYEFHTPDTVDTIAVQGSSTITPKLYKYQSADGIEILTIDEANIKKGTYLDQNGFAAIQDANAIRHNYQSLPAGTYLASGYYPKDNTEALGIAIFTPSGSIVERYRPNSASFDDYSVVITETLTIGVAGSVSKQPMLKRVSQ